MAKELQRFHFLITAEALNDLDVRLKLPDAKINRVLEYISEDLAVDPDRCGKPHWGQLGTLLYFAVFENVAVDFEIDRGEGVVTVRGLRLIS